MVILLIYWQKLDSKHKETAGTICRGCKETWDSKKACGFECEIDAVIGFPKAHMHDRRFLTRTPDRSASTEHQATNSNGLELLMSTNLDNSSSPQLASKRKPRQRRKNKGKTSPGSSSPDSDLDSMSRNPKYVAVSSSLELESIHVPPRTPRSAFGGTDTSAEDEVELSLLNEDERRAAAAGDDVEKSVSRPKGMSSKDKRGMVLLIILCESCSSSYHRKISSSVFHRPDSRCTSTLSYFYESTEAAKLTKPIVS